MSVVMASWSGRSARALRLALRLSGDDFAAMLGVSGRGVSKWEASPATELALRSQQLLDTALSRADADVQARFGKLVAVAESTALPTGSVDTATADCGAVLPDDDAYHPGPQLVASLRQSLHDYYLADNLLGPRVLMPVVRVFTGTVEHVRRGVTGRVLDELLRVGARYAELTGWLAHDAGDASAATGWYRQALEWAQCGGDLRMASFVLVRRSVQAAGQRDGGLAARLAIAAQRDASPGAGRVQAIAAQAEAVGHAIAGSERETAAALGRATTLAESAVDSTADDPATGRYCEMPLHLAITRATCHLELGRPTAAIEGFTAVLAVLPPHYHRDRGQYLARLAHAHALAGQPDEACRRAEESLAIALTTGSSRTVTDLRETARQLGPWARHAAVANLRAALTLDGR
ncbi:hypothetical protein GCM10010124_23270 [Pilimelia terevasa]|uniref:Uncharacterized protein n=1 Tax=Pilimelia terevasa TaxID=53372 RepID=A0A8J3FKS3_9ACTN|nr:hypothetical protein [Pilimelia terevasa]GGK29895.1 hypothetical protein GCM10010124_23270 [Pilimelia terevasa]